MTLTVGIPSRGINHSLHRVIRHALSLNVDEILVGINPGGDRSDLPLPYTDTRLKIFYHAQDIGLYGNFRFLCENSQSVFFAWLCTDDLLSPDVPQALKNFESSSTNLVIPSWNWAEYRPDQGFAFDVGNQIPGTYPRLETPKLRVDSALHCEPSWIFGIWRTSYLNKIFPKRNFDWLDTYLLQRVMLTKQIVLLKVATPTLIGTWNWANKIPNSVTPKGHNPFLAIMYQLKLLPSILLMSPGSIWSVVLRIKFLLVSSRNMNAKIKELRRG